MFVAARSRLGLLVTLPLIVRFLEQRILGVEPRIAQGHRLKLTVRPRLGPERSADLGRKSGFRAWSDRRSIGQTARRGRGASRETCAQRGDKDKNERPGVSASLAVRKHRFSGGYRHVRALQRLRCIEKHPWSIQGFAQCARRQRPIV